MEKSSTQPEKALAPILVIPSGRIIFANLVQFSKQLSGISVKPKLAFVTKNATQVDSSQDNTIMEILPDLIQPPRPPDQTGEEDTLPGVVSN